MWPLQSKRIENKESERIISRSEVKFSEKKYIQFSNHSKTGPTQKNFIE